MLRVSLLSLALLTLSGCPESTTITSMGSPDAGLADTDLADTMRTDEGVADTEVPDGPCEPQLDILFMVDNSNSMTEEQASLIDAWPILLDALTTGDFDGDGVAERDAFNDIHLAVVNSDMGTGGAPVFTCNEPDFGDDGQIVVAGDSCDVPGFVDFRTATDVVGDVACLLDRGRLGCGFEQPLDAVLKAITDEDDRIEFVDGTAGHASGANAGFLREGAALAIVVLTDEDDCSAADPDVFNSDSARYASPDLNLRCSQYPEALHRVARYVEGILRVKPDPRRIVLTGISGIPVDLAGESYTAILNDARMQEMPNPDDPSTLTPSCTVPGRGLAFPPRRLVTLARDLQTAGAATQMHSICQSDLGAPMRATAEAIRDAVASCD